MNSSMRSESRAIFDHLFEENECENDFRVSGMFEFKNPVFIIRDPEVIKKVTIKDFDHFQDHRFWMDEKSDKMLGKSLMALKGQTWRGKNLVK